MRKVLALGVSVLALGFAGSAAAETLTIMTGPQGGVWVPLGGALKALWEKEVPGISINTLPGAGIANVRGVNEGKAQIGFGNSISTVDGVHGNPPFKDKAENVCQLATLYPQYFQVVALADAGIESYKDLKGKSIAVQTRGNTAEVITQHILQAHGLSYKDMKVNFQASYNDAVSLMKDGHAQVFTLGTTIPASSVMDLASGRDIKLLPVDDAGFEAMKKINPGYTLNTVKAGTYPKQDNDVKVIGYATHLIVGCKVPEKEVYAMTKAMATHIPDMAAINSAMKSLTVKEMAVDIGVPFHPGAAKYYREAGAL
jgi:TRAP transporter TAXI family solute receptor